MAQSQTTHGVGGLTFDASKRHRPPELNVFFALILLVAVFEALGEEGARAFLGELKETAGAPSSEAWERLLAAVDAALAAAPGERTPLALETAVARYEAWEAERPGVSACLVADHVGSCSDRAGLQQDEEAEHKADDTDCDFHWRSFDVVEATVARTRSAAKSFGSY